MAMEETPVLLITGAATGFGAAIAEEGLRRQHHVIATARDTAKLADLKSRGADVLELDVTSDEATLAATLEKANNIHGRITHVFNCAGYLLEGAVEETSQKEVADIFNTNVMGTCNIVRAAAPYLRAAAKVPGRTVAVATFGSLGSWWCGPAISLYCSTKFAVSGLTEGLAAELRPFGIRVCCVEPGYTRTKFLSAGAGGGKAHRVKTARRLDEYKGTEADKLRDVMDAYDGKQPGDVDACASVILDVFTGTGVGKGKEIPIRLVLGSDCVKTIRDKCESTLGLLREWEEVAGSVDYPRQG